MKTKILFFFYLLSFIFALNAQWPTTVDDALFVDYGIYPYLIVDPNDESVIVVYLSDNQMRAKKYDRYGYPEWGGNTVILMDTAGGYWVRNMSGPEGQWGTVISDDSGGVIVCWEDYRHADLDPYYHRPTGSEVYLQRVDINGQIRYGINGKKISGPASEGFKVIGDMKTDYHDGYVLCFQNYAINSILRRYDRQANMLWEKTFVLLGIDLNATDEMGNIFVSNYMQQERYRHKYNLNGDSLWPDSLNGRIPDDITYRKGGAHSDGKGGVIGVGPSGRLKINKTDSLGNFVFGQNGIDLGGGQYFRIGNTTDNNGGIILSYSKDSTVKVQRINKSGNIVIDSLNSILCNHPECSGTMGIVSNFEYGAITVWSDLRNLPLRSFYAQHIDSIGNKLWDSTGLEFHTTSNEPFASVPIPVYRDGSGGMIMVLTELDAGLAVKLKQISKDGIFGYKPNLIQKKRTENNLEKQKIICYPNPFNNSVKIEFTLENNSTINLSIFDILGRKVKNLIKDKIKRGTHNIIWDGSDDKYKKVSTGLYFCQLIVDKKYHVNTKLIILN